MTTTTIAHGTPEDVASALDGMIGVVWWAMRGARREGLPTVARWEEDRLRVLLDVRQLARKRAQRRAPHPARCSCGDVAKYSVGGHLVCGDPWCEPWGPWDAIQLCGRCGDECAPEDHFTCVRCRGYGDE